MKQIMIWGAVCAACAKGPHTPKDIAGDIPVRIVNYADSAACELYIQPASDAKAKHDNLLGADYRLERIASTGSHELKLHQGTYNVGVKGCDAAWYAATERGPLAISGPIEVRIGWTPLKQGPPTPQGFAIESLSVNYLGGGGGGGGGDQGGEQACRHAEQECDPNHECCNDESLSCHWVERPDTDGVMKYGNWCERVP